MKNKQDKPQEALKGWQNAIEELMTPQEAAGHFVKRSKFGPWVEVEAPEEGSVILYCHPQAAPDALLKEAIDRINDMLQGDDGQAFKEAQRFVDKVAALDGKTSPAVWFNANGKVYGSVSDEQIEAVLLDAIADVRKRSGLDRYDDNAAQSKGAAK